MSEKVYAVLYKQDDPSKEIKINKEGMTIFPLQNPDKRMGHKKLRKC